MDDLTRRLLAGEFDRLTGADVRKRFQHEARQVRPVKPVDTAWRDDGLRAGDQVFVGAAGKLYLFREVPNTDMEGGAESEHRSTDAVGAGGGPGR